MYGILSLIKKMYGKKAMRRVLEIIKKYPEARPVKNLRSDVFTDESRLGTA